MTNSVRVQLYGGGIDSVCIAHLWKPDIKLFCNLGTAENPHELRRAMEAGCLIDQRLYLGDQVLANKILPGRNLLLVAIASFYGNNIMLGSTAGDTTHDKDARFLELSSLLLDHILGHDPLKAKPFHAAGLNVWAPAGLLTKAELVKRYLAADGDPQVLLNSRSCYGAHEEECGECRSCVRKYVALTLAGLKPKFLVKPDLHKALAYAQQRDRGPETLDIQKAIDYEHSQS